MLRFLVAARLQNLGGKPHQLAEILRGEVNEVQIPGTKIDLWRPLFRHPSLDRRHIQKMEEVKQDNRMFPGQPLQMLPIPPAQ